MLTAFLLAAAFQAPASSPTIAGAGDREEIICKTKKDPGSRASVRLCATQKEWDEQSKATAAGAWEPLASRSEASTPGIRSAGDPEEVVCQTKKASTSRVPVRLCAQRKEWEKRWSDSQAYIEGVRRAGTGAP